MKAQFQLSKDGCTLWVNAVSGMNIARFSSKGIDIHHDVKEQQKRGEQCLFCTHGADPFNPVPFQEDWVLFKRKLYEHHGLRVPARIKMDLRRNTNMNKVRIERKVTPPRRIAITLEPWEDRKGEQGGTEPGTVELKAASEPECFELRCDGGFQILNKGELASLGKAFLELSDHHVLLAPPRNIEEKDRRVTEKILDPAKMPKGKKRRATVSRVYG